MRIFRRQMYIALAITVAVVLGVGVVRAAYDQEDRDPGQYQSQRERDWDWGRDEGESDQYQARNVQLERQIARELRNEGLGEQGEIMILATGDRVILLGNVPDRDTKSTAERLAKEVPGVERLDNRLHVVERGRQVSDAQLERNINDRLPDRLSSNIRVDAQNGTATLQGSANNWRDAADAIDAAFAAGAQQVNSQLTVGAPAYGRAGTATEAERGYAPSYGYAPGTRGQAGTMRGRTQANPSDLRLAQQVAQELRQELPPEQNVEVVQPLSIYVTVKNGTATLHGYVRDTNQKQQAEQIARSIRGIRNVTNDLAIFSATGAMGRMGERQGFGDTSTQGQYDQSGADRTGRGMAGTRMQTSDRRMAQQIQRQLQDQFPDANINVTASQGTITLQGTVSDYSQKQQAEQVAQSFPGVQDVQNSLTVGQQGFGATGRQSESYPPQGYIPGQQGTSDQYNQGTARDQMGSQQGFEGTRDQSQFGQQGAASASDLALARQVAQKLQQQLSGIRVVQVMRPGTIYVMATQGTIMLHGSVQDGNIKQQAGTIARNIRGVRNVENTLNIGAAGGFAPSYGYIPGQGRQTQQGTRERGQSTQAGAALKAYGSNSDDISKATKIGQTLRSQLPSADITVIVSGNRATLWGTVPNAQDKQQAQQIASSVSGIRDIQNNLTVSGQSATAQGSTSGRQAAQTQFVADTDEMSGVSGTSDTSASAADMALAHQVANKLQQQLSGSAKVQVAAPNTIYVTASQGTVSLTGWITDQNIKQQAEQVAKSVSGVQNVRNLLGIGLDTGSFPPLGYTPGQESEFGDQQFEDDQSDYSQSESQDSDFPQSEDQDPGSY